jgi:hypothetical protein
MDGELLRRDAEATSRLVDLKKPVFAGFLIE